MPWTTGNKDVCPDRYSLSHGLVMQTLHIEERRWKWVGRNLRCVPPIYLE